CRPLAVHRPCCSFFFFYRYGDHRDLHSFPTRRSSDLDVRSSGAHHAEGRVAGGARGVLAKVAKVSGALRTNQWWGHMLGPIMCRSEEHTSELQSRENLVCRLLLEKKKNTTEHQTVSTT